MSQRKPRLNIVLQEVVDSAPCLASARNGLFLTCHQSGGIQDFITSGFSSEEIEHLKSAPQGLGVPKLKPR